MNLMRSLSHGFLCFDFNQRRAEFYRDLAEMYRRGEPLLVFLEGELFNARLTRDSSRQHVLRLLLRRLQANEGQGRVSQLLVPVVPAGDRLMLAGVEAATDKSAALFALAAAVEQQAEMRKTLLIHSLLPAALVPVCAGLIYVMSLMILSIDASTPDYVKPHLWTGFNGAAKWFAELAMQQGPLLLGLMALATLALLRSLPRWTGSLRLRADRAPVFGLYRDYQAGMLFSSLSMLLRAGRPLKASLEDLALQSSGWLRWQLRRAVGSLEEQPNDPVGAFSRGLVGPHLLSRTYTLKRSARQFADVLIELGTSEGPRVLQRVRKSALLMNICTVGSMAALATWLGLASITVPTKFSNLMQPASLMALKSAHEAQLQRP